MRAGRKAPAAMSVNERLLHLDADAVLARPWSGCAGRCFRLPGLGGVTRFAPPDATAPFRRPPSVAATAGVRMGCAMRGGRSASPGCRRADCTRVAQVRRARASAWPKSVDEARDRAAPRRPAFSARTPRRTAEVPNSGRRWPVSGACRPWSVAATAGGRMGMRGGRRRCGRDRRGADRPRA
jgi:hypothetical protein